MDAVEWGSPCVQFDAISRKVIGNEDCLHLSVFTSQVSELENIFLKKLENEIKNHSNLNIKKYTINNIK